MFFEMDADHRDRRPKGSSPDEPLDDPLRTPIGALSAFVSAPIWTCSTFARCRAFRGCISSDSHRARLRGARSKTNSCDENVRV